MMTRRAILSTGIAMGILQWNALAGASELAVDINFPGGSAEVISIDQRSRTVRILPTHHPDRGWRCWWYFRLDGLEKGETLTLDVGEAPWATPDQATFSDDDRRSWRHTGPGRREGKRIVYSVTAGRSGPHWFAWGPPFLGKDAKELVADIAGTEGLGAEPFLLSKTREGREVPALRFRPENDEEIRFGVWIQARQHAWESGASWVCRGLLEWLASSESEELRRETELVVVPLMDVDSVEIGAGGKNQNPWDHNRDWRESPHYPEVVAAQRGIRELNAAGRLHLFVDLHNPGANDREAFYYISPMAHLSEPARNNLKAFAGFSREFITGPIPFRGSLRESGANYDPKRWKFISKNWVARNTNESVVAVTLETPWNTPGSHTDGYRTVGRQLGMAIRRYLEEPDSGR